MMAAALLLLAACGTGDDDSASDESDVPSITRAEAHDEITQYEGFEALTEDEVDDMTEEWCNVLREGGRTAGMEVLNGIAREQNDAVATGEAALVLGTMTQYGCPELGDAMQSD